MTPLVARDVTAAKLLDMKPEEFRRLVEEGALPPPGPGMSGQVFLDTSPCLRIANMIREEINEILARYDVHSDAHERDELIDAACVQLADKALVIAASAHKPSDTSGQITGDKDCASVVGGPHT